MSYLLLRLESVSQSGQVRTQTKRKDVSLLGCRPAPLLRGRGQVARSAALGRAPRGPQFRAPLSLRIPGGAAVSPPAPVRSSLRSLMRPTPWGPEPHFPAWLRGPSVFFSLWVAPAVSSGPSWPVIATWPLPPAARHPPRDRAPCAQPAACALALALSLGPQLTACALTCPLAGTCGEPTAPSARRPPCLACSHTARTARLCVLSILVRPSPSSLSPCPPCPSPWPRCASCRPGPPGLPRASACPRPQRSSPWPRAASLPSFTPLSPPCSTP